MPAAPSLEAIQATRRKLQPHVRETPLWAWTEHGIRARLPEAEISLKLELFQHTGTFKVRGALATMLEFDDATLSRGVTAVSAGNHAMAVGWAAARLGTSAKVVMPKNANPARVAGCKAYGAQIVFVDDVHTAFATCERIQADEGRAFVHPFDGVGVALGTGSLALEMLEQASKPFDAVVVPIGGGGLCAGVACAIKRAAPQTKVIGVEPRGADSMHRSFAAGSPQPIDAVRTIADSLGAPHAADYSFALCREFVDELVMVEDDELTASMRLLMEDAKIAVEPAGAAATAALLGPLSERLASSRVGIVVCGANIDSATFAEYVTHD